MGKDKKKRDPSKAAALAAKKEAKAEKSALKRIAKQNSAADGGEDIDNVISSLAREVQTVEYEVLDGFPSPPRGNFTWVGCPNGMFYMFGGEYYDGAENIVFDDLLRWDPDAKPQSTQDTNNPNKQKGQWTRILTPAPRPPPRCAHTCIYYKDYIYVFGGECATAEKYHHYRDLWRLDVKKCVWEEVRARSGTPPVARSGHRAIQWRHHMLIFGGFHESLRAETRFFNDLHIFDFQTSTWTELKYSKLARLPPPRSACNIAIGTAPAEALFVYGGYSKVKNANAQGSSKSEGIIHVDCWMLPLKSLVGNMNSAASNPPSWERISRKGEYPSARAGSSSILHKNKMLLFGGVLDDEGDNHKMDSVFYDDLFSFDMERRRWFALRLKKSGGGGRRRKKKESEECKEDENSINDDSEEEIGKDDVEAISNGWDLDKLRHDMFAFIDRDGNIVYEKNENDDSSVCKAPQDVPTLTTEAESEIESVGHTEDGAVVGNDAAAEKIQPSLSAAPSSTISVEQSKKVQSSAVMKVDSKGMPASVARETPLPRINCAIAIKGNTLYIYGGVLEVGEREVTLDDCWSIDLNKRDKWTCISPGMMHRQVWKGVDDDDSYISSDQAADESDGNDNEATEEFEPIDEEDECSDEAEAKKLAKKEAKRAAKKAAKAGIRQEISDLKEKLGTDNEQRTPLMGESVAEFYARTTDYWTMEAATSVGQTAVDRGDVMSSKELKGEAFQMAKARYEEIQPVLERLNEIDAVQKEAEENRKDKKKAKADKKAKKDRLK